MKNYLQRINMDSTWIFSLDGVKFLVDPWLTGTETDGFRWLNSQWHVHSVMDINALPAYDAILITQPYDDHCHINTLKALATDKPVFADRRAAKKIAKHMKGLPVQIVDEKKKSRTIFRDISFFLSPADMLYNGCYMQSGEKSILYLPHGIEMREKYTRHFPAHADVVLTAASQYFLPFWLGGKVAKGMENVKAIDERFSPGKILTTHDEPKEGVGLVTRMAKKHYPTQEELSAYVGAHAAIIDSHEETGI